MDVRRFLEGGGEIKVLADADSGLDGYRKRISDSMSEKRTKYAQKGASGRKETLRQNGRLGAGKRRREDDE